MRAATSRLVAASPARPLTSMTGTADMGNTFSNLLTKQS
jgi:hypothetical protein